MSEQEQMEASREHAAAIAVSPQAKQVVEAMLFAADEPVTLQTLRVVFDDVNRDVPDADKITATNDEIRAIVDALNAEYQESHRAYRIQQIAGGYVFATEKDFATWVGKLFKEKARRRLSQTAVETLAIIAYKQPITKSEVEFIRGVNADYILRTLLEKNLVTITGRAHGPGRPLLYGTTGDFLKHFGLNEITDLPKPREIEELIGETEFEVEKRMLADQEEIEFKEKLHEKLDPNSRAPHIPRKKSKLQLSHGEGDGKTVVEKKSAPPVFTQEEKPETAEAVERHADTPEGVEEIDRESIVSVEPEPEIPSVTPVIEEVRAEVEDAIAVTSSSPPAFEDELPTAETEMTVRPEPQRSSVPEIAAPLPPDETVYENVDGETTPMAGDAEMYESQKGWSKWKTKVKMFFRKLFG